MAALSSPPRTKRLFALAALMGAALAASAPSAGAAARLTPRALVQHVAASFPYSNLRAIPGLSRLIGQESSGQSAVSMVGSPVPITINGVTYTMYLEVDAGGFGFPPDAIADLERTATTRGHVTAIQDHLYLMSAPSGLTFTHNSALSKATVTSSAGFDPNKFAFTYKADGPGQTTKCQVYSGGQGVYQQTMGTISARRFKLATGTSPFFGNITTAPKSAILISDPGCVGPSIGGRFPRYQSCDGAETIVSGSPSQIWEGDLGYRGKHALEAADSSPAPTQTELTDHLALGLVPGADMPAAVHGPHGAYARLLTAGNPFMSGGALFVAHSAPLVSRGHVCSYERETHRYITTRYTGILQPTVASPLAGLLDTGTLNLAPRKATLILRHYVS